MHVQSVFKGATYTYILLKLFGEAISAYLKALRHLMGTVTDQYSVMKRKYLVGFILRIKV